MTGRRRWIVVLGAVACGPRPAATTAVVASGDAGAVGRFLPLTDQTVLSYETKDEDTGERGTIILQVSRRSSGGVELNDGGRVTRLELAPDGVRYSTGGYWLKAPLEVGACWQGKTGKVTCQISQLGASAAGIGTLTGRRYSP